ncbi:hypothetical protein AMTR_s00004p00270750 [Amborella trichopoda]|uniref:Uncharacterized protein n=1 Tax=Amborella trichopoda TaxID=13333 RepID=W1NEG8_AMBTC|nr:hypothetical protein AMTR_s00004p00270750 [Amborella trichopoda]
MSFLVDFPSEKSLLKVSARVAFLLLVLPVQSNRRGGGSLIHNFLVVVVVVALQFKMYPLLDRGAVLRGMSDSRTRFDPLQIDPLALVVIEDDEVVRELASLPILPAVADSFVGEIMSLPFPPAVADSSVGALVTYENSVEDENVLEPQPLSIIILFAQRWLVATDLVTIDGGSSKVEESLKFSLSKTVPQLAEDASL